MVSLSVGVITGAPTFFWADLWRAITDRGRVELTVHFCSRETLEAHDLRSQYGVEGDWEADLLGGYEHRFLPNRIPGGSWRRAPGGLWNPAVRGVPDRHNAVVLTGWNDLTWWHAVAACRVKSVPYLVLTDANVARELPRYGTFLSLLRRTFLPGALIRSAAGCLSPGRAGRDFYRLFGVPESDIHEAAVTVDVERIRTEAQRLDGERQTIRASFGFDEEDFVVLFCGRLAPEKRPLLLADAVSELEGAKLLVVGDGPLRTQLEAAVDRVLTGRATLVGFQGRSSIVRHYLAADVLALPSVCEAWGLVVNEALACGIPAVVSEVAGSARDLIVPGRTGELVRPGDRRSLVEALASVRDAEVSRHERARWCQEVIAGWTLDEAASRLETACNAVVGREVPPAVRD